MNDAGVTHARDGRAALAQRLWRAFVLLLVGTLAAGPAHAQIDEGARSTRYERRAVPDPARRGQADGANRSRSTDLPSWAEPSVPSSPRESFRTRTPPGPGGGGGADPTREQVPLGGLEWLLLAGGGYAVWKLRRDGETDGALFGGL